MENIIKTIASHENYAIVQREGSTGIKCYECGLISYNQGDIEHCYCGNCHAYHKDKLMQPTYRFKAINYMGKLVDLETHNAFLIHKKNVYQSTGFYDKNGVELYSGFVVESESHEPKRYLIKMIEGDFVMTRPDLERFPINITHFYPSIGTDLVFVGVYDMDKNLL